MIVSCLAARVGQPRISPYYTPMHPETTGAGSLPTPAFISGLLFCLNLPANQIYGTDIYGLMCFTGTGIELLGVSSVLADISPLTHSTIRRYSVSLGRVPTGLSVWTTMRP